MGDSKIKFEYEKPKLSIVLLKFSDIIATSGGESQEDSLGGNSGGGGWTQWN